MFVNGEKIIKVLETIAPPHLAEEWDNCGLLVGSGNREVAKILVALEINEDVVQEAISKSADMIVTHHPLIFKAMKRISDNDPIGKLILKLIKHGISVYSAHTSLDSAKGGINDDLARRLDLKQVKTLMPGKDAVRFKLTVFVPSSHTEGVRSAMAEQGAGQIGSYSDCAFVGKGNGMFKPLEGSKPYLGVQNVIEHVEEDRLEVIVPQDRLSQVVAAMLKVHPYEMPAYDLVKLANEIDGLGIGRVGELGEAVSVSDFLMTIKAVLDLDEIRFAGKKDALVRRIALCSGAGGDLLTAAVKQGADLYLTGDVKHHEYRDAELLGLALVDMGHFASENLYMSVLKEKLEGIFEQRDYDVKVVLSEALKPPYENY